MAKKRKSVPIQAQRHPASPDSLPREVLRLRQLGNYTKAVELIRELQRSQPGAATQALWAETTLERIEFLLNRGRVADANRQIAQARSEQPDLAPRLDGLSARSRALHGDWDSLFRDLQDPQRSPAAEEAIARELTDLDVLAQTSCLTEDHPLRQAAQKLAKAFHQVTSGPVDRLDLPELSRRSPLAGWRLLIQAISCFYAGQDPQCERLLQAIAVDSAAARGATILRAAMQGKSTPPLCQQLCSGAAQMLTAVTQLEQALKPGATDGKLLPLVSQAFKSVEQSAPQLVQPFRQRLLARLSVLKTPTHRLALHLHPIVADSSFWQEWAVAYQQDQGTRPLAAGMWEEFRQQSRAEGQLNPQAEAALLIHMADLLADSAAGPSRPVVKQVSQFVREVYQGQNQSIQRASVLGSGLQPGKDYLNVERMFHRACALDPHPDNFAPWLQWEKGRRNGNPEQAAEAWVKLHPNDLLPLQALVELHEERGATAKAQKFLDKALQLDRLNPRLHDAQMRLAVANAMRQLRAGKTHLVPPQIQILTDMPQMQRGHRPALLSALRCLQHDQKGETEAARLALQAAADNLGSRCLALALVQNLVSQKKATTLKTAGEKMKIKGDELQALPRLAQIEREFRLRLVLPDSWEDGLIQQLRKSSKQIDSASLADICDDAVQRDYEELAFAISQIGLYRPDPWPARFLLYRAQSLPAWHDERIHEGLAAAYQMARQQGDTELQREVLQAAGEEGLHPHDLQGTAEEAAATLSAEKQAREYPDDEPETCDCADCRAERAASDSDILEILMEAFGRAESRR